MIGEPVGDVGLAGFTHPDQVRRQAPGPVGNMRDDVAPAIGRERISVQEHDRDITVSRVAIAHERIEYFNGGHGASLPRDRWGHEV